MQSQISIFWFRRDLRLDDNNGLYKALNSGNLVLPIFIFDKEILDELPTKDARVEFIRDTLTGIQKELGSLGSSLDVRYGNPLEIWTQFIKDYPLKAVFTNHDYEPYAHERDGQVGQLLAENEIEFHTFKDQVIFEKQEILSQSGTPYTVFTPYSRVWRSQFSPSHYKPFNTEPHFNQFMKMDPLPIPSLKSMGFESTGIPFPDKIPDKKIIKVYDQTRDFPAQTGTTHVGIHLRFGTLSIRKLAHVASKLNATYLNELIWREFYMQILWNFPHVVSGPFRKKYESIPWRDDPEGLEKWKTGKTGYPLVDAGMRELATTGYMHNRVRMVVASFLTKHLLINWQYGEAWFAEKLLDFELASNSGGWQWAAGCGTDAAPYFRIFNPTSQLKKFDKDLVYVKKWVPEYGTEDYPEPIVDHKMARERCLKVYKTALDQFTG